MDYTSDFSPVPEIFWSFETGEAFRSCSMCDRDIMEEGANYLVEKAFEKQETVFEYAMCIDCYQVLRDELSENSKKLITHYFEEHVDFEKRRTDCLKRHGRNAMRWIDRCMITGKARAACEAYQIYGWFIDKDIVFTEMPYMLSGDAIEDIVKLLSDETLGALNDFSDKLFGIGQPRGLLLI